MSYLKRMEEERDELSNKLNKLRFFKCGETFKSLPDEKKSLMTHQCSLMGMYLNVLNQRIDMEKDSHEISR